MTHVEYRLLLGTRTVMLRLPRVVVSHCQPAPVPLAVLWVSTAPQVRSAFCREPTLSHQRALLRVVPVVRRHLVQARPHLAVLCMSVLDIVPWALVVPLL